MTSPARRTVVLLTLLVASLVPSSGALGAAPNDDVHVEVSTQPEIAFVGGTIGRRSTVVRAAARYTTAGLSLPDLVVRFHDDRAGCHDMRGTFQPAGTTGLIDLCYEGELLVLHELGHAWEHFNLADRDRRRFEELTGATTWRSRSVAWHRRGAEIAANTLAAGLLSVPLDSIVGHSLEFDRFRALTGLSSPRLAEVHPSADRPAPLTASERQRLAAFEVWRSTAD